jgi:D-glycero-alpha-D-manno-heptose-7-phosphate kinase
MIITQTPLRISFAGGGTDLPGYYTREDGGVVSTAIDKYVFVIVTQRFDQKIYVNYTKKEIVDSVDEIRHELVREALRYTGLREGIEITMLADVPAEGTGLGSSSSITVGLLNAFYAFQGEQVTAERLAREAAEIEIDCLRKPIGKQDQYIAAFGGLREFKFKRDGSVETEPVRLTPEERRRLSSHCLMFYTGVTRKAADVLKEQQSNDAQFQAACRTLHQFVKTAREALEGGQFHQLAKVLHRSWLIKKELAARATNDVIDKMYDDALRAGALGGKILGAGGGGLLFLYVPPDKQEVVRAALRGFRELPFALEQHGSKVIFNMSRQPNR